MGPAAIEIGFSDGSASLTINVVGGALVSNSDGEAIKARGTGNLMTNNGTIEGRGGMALLIPALGLLAAIGRRRART